MLLQQIDNRIRDIEHEIEALRQSRSWYDSLPKYWPKLGFEPYVILPGESEPQEVFTLFQAIQIVKDKAQKERNSGDMEQTEIELTLSLACAIATSIDVLRKLERRIAVIIKKYEDGLITQEDKDNQIILLIIKHYQEERKGITRGSLSDEVLAIKGVNPDVFNEIHNLLNREIGVRDVSRLQGHLKRLLFEIDYLEDDCKMILRMLCKQFPEFIQIIKNEEDEEAYKNLHWDSRYSGLQIQEILINIEEIKIDRLSILSRQKQYRLIKRVLHRLQLMDDPSGTIVVPRSYDSHLDNYNKELREIDVKKQETVDLTSQIREGIHAALEEIERE